MRSRQDAGDVFRELSRASQQPASQSDLKDRDAQNRRGMKQDQNNHPHPEIACRATVGSHVVTLAAEYRLSIPDEVNGGTEHYNQAQAKKYL
jgi:hypothetical protein